MQPLFALLFFCALGILIGMVLHWQSCARVWPWLLVDTVVCALCAMLGGMLFAGVGFLLRTLLAGVLAAGAALLLGRLRG